ncbi:MAG: Rrf2 family transcriptional regulator, partial [Marivivens sp.]|nr:Rrf2 family transcriptional regulator [Marivivens sp.]
MRLTTRTNLAIRVLMYCGTHLDQITPSSIIADACNASANHLAQVVH